MPNNLSVELGIAAGLLVGLVVVFEIGYRLGRRASMRREEGGDKSSGQVGAIQGAMLGLLGLLLAFCFSGAASRFIERQDLILQESNAIGTAYLRADLLDEPYASRMRQVLAQYVKHRVEISKSLGKGEIDRREVDEQVARFHAQLWEAAKEGTLVKPAAMVAVLNPVNDVIDFHSTRTAAGLKHLPLLILSLLVACSLLAMAVIGYGCALSGRRSLPMTIPLVILIATSLWTTIDLDNPRAGLIRLSDAPLQQLNLKGSP